MEFGRKGRGGEGLRNNSSPLPPEALWTLLFIVLMEVFLVFTEIILVIVVFYQLPNQRMVPIFPLVSGFLNT